jgi:hypothetical protein
MIDEVSLRARELASDSSLTDHDFWRMLEAVNAELSRLARRQAPVPIRLLYARRLLERAMAWRGNDLTG